jgi:chromosome segregation protein
VFLKRVVLSGFKSFADSTVIELGPGLSVFVGPNGSGKSNVVDAVRWVLALSPASELRVERQEDLLFQGAPGRRPAQVAEVRLVFDNEDGGLDVPQSEVTVTRRLYRGGESEYLLNGVPCRRRDVQRLFTGTGLGGYGHAVIGQGNIEAVLVADDEERRLMLEEAAGAAGYREERRQALSELAQADEGWRRVGAELAAAEARLGPLQAEAERAEAAAELTRQLFALEVAALRHRHQAAETRAESLQARRERLVAEARSLAHAEAALGAAQDTIWAASQALGLHLFACDEAIARAEALAARWRARRESLGERQALLQRQVERARNEVERLEAEARAAEERRRGLEARLGDLAAKTAAVRAVPEGMMSPALLRERCDRLLADRERLATAMTGLEGALREAEAAALAKASEATAARLAAEEAEAVLRRLEASLAERQALLARLEEALRLSEARSVRPAARAVAEAARRGELPGVIGLLGHLLKAPGGLALALRVALGGQYDAVVVESEVAARAGIEYLRRRRIGVATFLPLPLLRHRPRPAPPAGGRWLGDLVTTPEHLRPALEATVGQVLVLPDLETALRHVRQHRPTYRVVTPAGELLLPNGSVSGGYRPTAPAVDPNQLERAEQEVAALTERVGEARRDVIARRQAAQAAALASEEAAFARERLRQQLDALGRQAAAVAAELARLEPVLTASAELEVALAAREEELRLEGMLREEERSAELLQASLATARAALEREEAALGEVAAALALEPAAAPAAADLVAHRQTVRRAVRAFEALARHVERHLRTLATRKARLESEAQRLAAEAERQAAEAIQARRRLEEEFGAEVEGEARAVDERELFRLRRALAELGPVRPESPAELAEARRRVEALRTEWADLAAAKERLIRTIARADAELERRFRAALAVCRRHFAEIVGDLFPGGEGDLVAAGDGVALAVRLPGKRTRSLALASGGERSLVALAFLLALVRMRRTPIQVLDEADAALDEENVARFVGFLKRHRGQQFLLITHQRATMEAADVLVGVAMPEPGVTRVYTLQVGEGEHGHLGTA